MTKNLSVRRGETFSTVPARTLHITYAGQRIEVVYRERTDTPETVAARATDAMKHAGWTTPPVALDLLSAVAKAMAGPRIYGRAYLVRDGKPVDVYTGEELEL